MESVKPVGGPANIKAEHQDEEEVSTLSISLFGVKNVIIISSTNF